MPKPVYLLTVHEAHKENNSFIDQIWAKYELLDSGECGSVGTPAFDAECSELAHLMACMSELCKHLVGVSRGYTDYHQGRAIHMADSRIH